MNFIQRIVSTLGIGGRSSLTAAPSGSMALARPRMSDRVIQTLNRIYRYRVELKMDVRDAAILGAENPLNPNRRLLYALYREVEQDGHLSSAVQSRKLNTLREAFVLRDEKTKRIDDDLRDLFKRPWFYDFCHHALDSKFWGHSLVEFGLIDKDGHFTRVDLVPREHVKPETSEILIDQTDMSGIYWPDAKEGKWLIEVGDCYDLGLYKKASRYVILKRYSLTDWARRSEKYGQPMLTIRTASRDKKELDAKEDMAANFGTNGWAILDDQDQIDLIESNQAFTWQIFDSLSERMDKYLSKLILGQTMTSDDGSSLSQAQVHERVLEAYTEADMRWLSFQVNLKLIPFLIRHGYPLAGKEFEWFRFTPEHEQAMLEKKKLLTPPPPPPSRSASR